MKLQQIVLGLLLWVCGLVICGEEARAWQEEGHAGLAKAALSILPEEVPVFFREGAELAAHCAIDPDVRKTPEAPTLRARESPDHYIDLERFDDARKLSSRYDVMPQMVAKGFRAEQLGFAPWATIELTEQLMVAFSEYRRWPKNESIQVKILVYAGELAHYATDLGQPLHTTVHHDGRALPDGSSPRIGMHRKVDGWLNGLAKEPLSSVQGVETESLGDLFDEVFDWTEASHQQVDRLYELYEKNEAAAIEAFSRERFRANAKFLASLYRAAWERSEKAQVPDWLER